MLYNYVLYLFDALEIESHTSYTKGDSILYPFFGSTDTFVDSEDLYHPIWTILVVTTCS